MAEDENLSTNQNLVSGSQSDSAKGLLSRRVFLKKSALLSAPVIMTIASGPVWARNCTMSGRLSGNLSDSGPVCPPAACSPGYWKQDQHLGSWSNTLPYTSGSYFNEAFVVTAFPATATLLQVIRGEVLPVYPASAACDAIKDKARDKLALLAFHAVAGLQNSLMLGVLDYPHSTATVKAQFQAGFTAYNNCYRQGVLDAKDFLEAPYLNVHFCPFGNDGTNTDQNIP